MHDPSYLQDLASWYLVGEKEQETAKKISSNYHKAIFLKRRNERISNVIKHLKVSTEIISFIEHHLAHLAAAYYTSPNININKPVLGLTCDGAGDGLSATVSICKGNNIKRISSTSRHASLGKIYSRITMLLGMKPWEHEYKIMGLAPYSEEALAIKESKKLQKLLKLSKDGLQFKLGTSLSTNYSYNYLKENFERVRFDNIAGAVQYFTESMLVNWVRSAIKNTKIKDIVCGGGVFMNVKANMLLQNIPELKTMYVMPSASDESLSIGAALHYYHNHFKIFNNQNGSLDNLYLGSDINSSDIKKTLDKVRKETNYKIEKNINLEKKLGTLLSKGEVVSICRGRAEWGARALGNRSIIARADSKEIVQKINSQIKMRDFWMPFAPTIIDNKYSSCIEDKKNIKPKFMTFALPSKDKAQSSLSGAMHPVDKTCRPQILSKKTNPFLYTTLNYYCKKYKQYGVLQTSFNIHGEPIVNKPNEAYSTLKRSGLKYLVLGSYLISKN